MDRNELRRLQKAARENDKKHLAEWAENFQNQMEYLLRKEYESRYQDEMKHSVENMIIAVAYTAHFSEETNLKKGCLGEFMSDLFATLDMYRTGEFKPEEYRKELTDNGVDIGEITYVPRQSKIVTVCGSFDKSVFNKLTNKKQIVIFANNDRKMNEDKVRASDILYIIEKERFKAEIELAKSLNKTILYQEDEKYELSESEQD